ncbi:putative quinol monooxygenase [Streptomyces sp. KL116D]|uniref:putative quinol monooxygenase n=1 Tax=Streptomyces sp. KL116D TaxID=3045152 RepID=UPI003558FB92
MAHGYIGSMKARPDSRDEVVSILLSGVDGLREAGCHLYVVSVSDDDDVTIWVTEVWQSSTITMLSLELPEAKAAIGSAMPLLTGDFTRQELTVVGGLGL